MVLGYEVRTLGGALLARRLRAVRRQLQHPRAHLHHAHPGHACSPRRSRCRASPATRTVGATSRRFSSGAVRLDTAQVVAGYTRPLPDGGRIADAHLLPAQQPPVPVQHRAQPARGVQPGRLHLPPADHRRLASRGASRRGRATAAASWATRCSSPTRAVPPSATSTCWAAVTGSEVYRYPLPNIIAYSVTSVRSETTDEIITQRTVYDFSDRPQYLASTCTGGTDRRRALRRRGAGVLHHAHAGPVGAVPEQGHGALGEPLEAVVTLLLRAVDGHRRPVAPTRSKSSATPPAAWAATRCSCPTASAFRCRTARSSTTPS